jgi:Flp pilus assembly protein CpaB
MKTRLIGAILAIVLALVGTVVLTGYVGGADARAADGAAFVPVYVVSQEIPAGTAAESIGAFITVKQIPAMAAVPGRVTKLGKLSGKVADTALKPGEQLLMSRWVSAAEQAAHGGVALPDGMQSVTIALPVEQVAGGAITAGDTVGVVIAATVKAAGASDEVSIAKQVFHKVLVTTVQQGSTTTTTKRTDATTEPVSVVMITLARTTPDIEKLVWGQKFGTVWLTIEPKTADEAGASAVDGNAVFQ